MASKRDRRRDEEAKDDRQAAEAAKDKRQAEEAKDDRQAKHRKAKGGTTTTERLKALSHQSGTDAMNAAPGSYPADPANADAVFTTGPGQAVEYNYVRVDGSGGDYAPQQSSFTAPVAGHGQVLTPAAAGEMPAGMENNVT